jgi:pimeloyl-ACP methyl ester carboxylesterase
MPTLNRSGVKIHYQIHGEGPTILLSHGFSASSEMWRGQIEALSRRHQLIVWDMRGHGETECPPEPSEYSEAATVADMAALLDAAGADQAIVGGLSLGGYMSLAFHLEHPKRVRALLVIDTGPGFRNQQARERWNQRAM